MHEPEYLREVQYAQPTNLTSRGDLHTKYSTASVGWFEWLAQAFDWRGDILEVGCGPGWMWPYVGHVAAGAIRLTLTDLSRGMVDAARERTTVIPSIAVVAARAASADALPFGDDMFDIVVANHMLYHVPDPARAAAEIARVLRPGGFLVAATNGPNHMKELFDLEAEVFGRSRRGFTAAPFDKNSGSGVLQRVFAVVTWREYVDQLDCTEADDVVRYIATAPPASEASPKQIKRLHALTTKRMAEGNGRLLVTKETGVFVAS